MATSKSALKRLRNSKKIHQRNKSRKTSLKTTEKKFRAAIAASEKEAALTLMKECFSKYDKAAKVGVIHSNKADNKKAQLNKLFNSLG